MCMLTQCQRHADDEEYKMRKVTPEQIAQKREEIFLGQETHDYKKH